MSELLPVFPAFSENTTEEDFVHHCKFVKQKVTTFAHSNCQTEKELLVISSPVVTVNILLFCGEHSEPSELWTDGEIIRKSQDLLEVCLRSHNVKSVGAIFRQQFDDSSCERKTFGEAIIEEVRARLKKDNLKEYPTAIRLFIWFLSNAEEEFLANHLSPCLAISLLLTDDYVPENREKGLVCLSKIVSKSTSVHLQWYDRCDVIFDSLSKMLYFNEGSAVELVYSTCLILLKKCYSTEEDLRFSKADTVFQRLIEAATLEQNIVARETYSKLLDSYIELQKIRAIMWRIDLFRVFEDYLEDNREKASGMHENTLKALLNFCRHCYPRLKHFLQPTLELTVKFVYEQFRHKSAIEKSCELVLKSIWQLLASEEQEEFELLTHGLENIPSENCKFVTFIAENLCCFKKS